MRSSNLTFKWYLAGTTPVLSVRSSLFYCAGVISSVQVSYGSLVTFSASSVGAVCGKRLCSRFVSHSKRFLDKKLHGTYSINGDHQQRLGRRAVTDCSRKTSADFNRSRGMPHQEKPDFGRTTTPEGRTRYLGRRPGRYQC